MIAGSWTAALKGRPVYDGRVEDDGGGAAPEGCATYEARTQTPERTRTTIPKEDLDEDEAFSRIRCPLCAWQPSPNDRWSCVWVEGSPEPPFLSCGAIWNTFKTRGSCPGCRHRWRWTSCLRCAGWSLHEDWYEVSPA